MGFFRHALSCARTAAHHPTLRAPLVSLGLTALALLLLVLVLLSVPGPIKGLYWFAVSNEQSAAGDLKAGVLGWCTNGTSNCTYAPLSDNAYLSTMIDTGEALTVRIMLPLACYWMILVLVLWVALQALSGLAYAIRDLDSIRRHLWFAAAEAAVLCVSLFGNVLCWLAFGLGRTAYLSVLRGGGRPASGHAMETTAVAAMLSLLSLGFAGWGLHLRLARAQADWKGEAIMVRRRSMALFGAQAGRGGGGGGLAVAEAGSADSDASTRSEKDAVPAYSGAKHRQSMLKVVDPAEQLDPALERELEVARRNSRRESAVVGPDQYAR
ncbi:hypothetical protein Q5752_004864 [Cryptotrichosporon argae]